MVFWKDSGGLNAAGAKHGGEVYVFLIGEGVLTSCVRGGWVLSGCPMSPRGFLVLLT